MAAQRVLFHYGIELEGLKYNSSELGELRRRLGRSAKVEITFDPGNLGQIHVLDPLKQTYICVPALDQAYAKGLSLWQNRVIRRYAQHQLQGRTDIVALAQAKAEIRALIDRDFSRKSTRGRKRHARFLEDHTKATLSERARNQLALAGSPSDDLPNSSGMRLPLMQQTQENAHASRGVGVPDTTAGRPSLFADEEILPVFEAALDLPHSPIKTAASSNGISVRREADD